jgi:LAO/AO transport system kinase
MPHDDGSTATEVAERALGRGRHQVARLVSLVEDQRPAAAARRDEAFAVLAAAAAARGHQPHILGITGTPGSGKSSLLARLARRMIAVDSAVTVAIVAVDPSSPTSKGALLGDRTRMNLDPGERRVYFRSQASANALGGLAPSTYNVCHALSLIFDCVIVETVGIGQSEADIRHLADKVYLVLAPLGGDEIQYLKAGIIEIPDAFIVNKWDEPAAAKTYHQLRASLWLARPFDADEI